MRSADPPGGGGAAGKAPRADRSGRGPGAVVPARRQRRTAGGGDRGTGHRGTPGLLDRHVSRYSPHAAKAHSGSVGARKSAGQRLAVMDPPESGRSAVCSRHGWRTALQSARSRGPPERIRHKAQPDTEGIETGRREGCLIAEQSQSPARYRGHRNLIFSTIPEVMSSWGHKAQPDTEGIETRSGCRR